MANLLFQMIFYFINVVDGKNPSLGCVTTGGKILIHSPHEKNRQNDNQLPTIRYLNFNRKITSLACGNYKAFYCFHS